MTNTFHKSANVCKSSILQLAPLPKKMVHTNGVGRFLLLGLQDLVLRQGFCCYDRPMTSLEIAEHYFDLSNKSDFANISKLFADSTTYSSQNTGLYLGKTDIIAMQKSFHAKFSSLKWRVNSVKEVKPGIILFDCDFSAEMQNGEKIESSGLEYVVVHDGKIQHIEIRNK